jgi:hypothetical protein
MWEHVSRIICESKTKRLFVQTLFLRGKKSSYKKEA